MGQTVYVDLFFLINFSMDFLCFYLTAQLLGIKARVGRWILAASLGGIYANAALFLGVGGILAIAIDLAACALMCLVAFGGGRALLGRIPVYVAVSMTLGGFMTAIFALLNRAKLPLGTVESDGISAWTLALLAAVSAALTLAGGRFFRRRSSKKYATVKISMGKKQTTLEAFCDSGNLLKEPISNKPCILVNTRAVRDVLPRQITDLAAKQGVTGIESLDSKLATRVRLIPTMTAVGGGMLIAVRVDKILICDDKEERETDALIALCNSDFGEGATALIPSELLI